MRCSLKITLLTVLSLLPAFLYSQIVVKGTKDIPASPFFYYNDIGVRQQDINIGKKAKIINTNTPIILYASDEAMSGFLLLPGDTVTIGFKNYTYKISSENKKRNAELALFETVYRSFLVKKYIASLNHIPDYSTTLIYDSLISIDYERASKLTAEYQRRNANSNEYISILNKLINIKRLLARLEFTRFANERYFREGTIGKYYNIYPLFNNRLDSLLLPDSVRCDIRMGFYLGFWSLLAKDNNRSVYKKRIAGYADYISALINGTGAYCDPVRDVLQFHLLGEIEKTQSDSLYGFYFTKLANSSFVGSAIKSKLPQKADSTSNNALINLKKEAAGNLRALLESNKGNLLYIDFWASWCIPCLKEMPFSKKLRDGFKNKKVKFIYLSVDDNYEPWRNACKNLNLAGHTENYLLANGSNAPVLEKLNVSTFPRYVLIDADGNILTSDAPRPSDPALKSLLLRYLK